MSGMPKHGGFSHVSLSVRDVAASSRWYTDVLGFAPFDEPPGHGWTEVIMLHPTGAIVGLQQHDANAGEAFDPVRTGADHLAFRVGSRAELDDWQQFLAERGVTHSPIADESYGSVLCLRDPDGIQLELFHRENHP